MGIVQQVVSAHGTPEPASVFFQQPDCNEFNFRIFLHFFLKGNKGPFTVIGMYVFKSIPAYHFFRLILEYMPDGWGSKRDGASGIQQQDAVERVGNKVAVEKFAFLQFFLGPLSFGNVTAYTHDTDLVAFPVMNQRDGMEQVN